MLNMTLGQGNNAITPQQISSWVQPVVLGQAQGGTTAYVNPNYQATPSNAALTGNVATITTGTNGFLPGQFINCFTMTNATALVTAAGQLPWGPITPTSTTILTFAAQQSNIVSTASGGAVMVCQTLVTAGPNGAIVTGINASTNDGSNDTLVLYECNAAYAPGNNYTSTVTAAGTLTLTYVSNFQQWFTGSTTHTVKLPVVSSLPTLSNGQLTLPFSLSFQVINVSTGAVTVQSSGSNTILAQAANTVAIYTYNGNAQTDATSWNVTYYAPITCIPICAVQVPLNSGTNGTTAAVNLLNNVIFPALKNDSAGNYCYVLSPGFSLLVNSSFAILTSGKVCTVNVICKENY